MIVGVTRGTRVYGTTGDGLNGLSDFKNPWFDTSYMSLAQTIKKNKIFMIYDRSHKAPTRDHRVSQGSQGTTGGHL